MYLTLITAFLDYYIRSEEYFVKKVDITSTINIEDDLKQSINLKPNLKKVLVVDDNPINRKLLCKILSNEYIAIEASNGKVAIDMIYKYVNEISAVMLDLVMPEMDGYEVLNLLHHNLLFKNIPVIITTENNDIDNEIKALKQGAWDFVSKPYNPEIIKFRLNNVIERSHLHAFEKLKYITEFDSLTEIYNKSKFYEVTQEMLIKNQDKKFTFIRFDIDRFKLINTFFGMSEGDRLLKYIASELQRLSYGNELFTYGRIEADVFCICLFYDIVAGKALLESARRSFENYDLDYSIVPSFGIYLIEDNTMPIHTMFDMATLAAKQCKDSYMEYYSFYNEALSKTLIKEQAITNDMDMALENEQFKLYFQPKYDLKSNTINGAEVLVRWKHPSKGIISPSEFIPLFERNGFISKLDFYVWDKACKLLRDWIDEDINPLPISVNVSRVNLYNPKLENTIINLVKKYDISPGLFNLELTESAYTDNPIIIKRIMTNLHSYGFIILMDDFGSGYSSLNVLKDIPIDALKLDMKFLSDSDCASRSESILSSIIEMAHKLNIKVVAEGVETNAQSEFLTNIGCDYAQGFYFSKPITTEKYEELIKTVDLERRNYDYFTKNFNC